MDVILKFCIIAIGALTFFIGLSNGECPNNKQLVQAGVERCFSDIGLNSQTLASTDMSAVKKLCKDQVYERAITCLRDIYDACINHDEIRGFLNKLINFDHYNSAFKYICDNLDVLDKNSECIQKVDTEGAARICVETEAKKFETEIAAKTQKGELNSEDIEAIFPLLCKYMDSIVSCAIQPYQACGDQVMNIMSRTLKLVIPNICNEIGAAGDTAGISSSGVLILYSLLMAISMIWRLSV